MKRGLAELESSSDTPASALSAEEITSKKVRHEHPRSPSAILKSFRCHEPGCDKAYTKPSKLADHMRSHSGERPFCCSEPGCLKRFLRKSHLQAHARSHISKEERPYACPQESCHQRFSTRQHLRQHEEGHARPTPYRCETCGAAFHKNHQYKRHVAETHLQTKPCPCPQQGCNMSFAYSSILERHLARVHDPTRRYGCEIDGCGEKFLKWSHLQHHIKRDHKMPCAHCGKTYSDVTALRLHVETHEVPLTSRLRFACAQCDKRFTKACTLKRHVSFIHKGIREFKCTVCEKEFAHKRTLKSHMIREHSDQKREDQKNVKVASEPVGLFNQLTGAGYDSSRRHLACLKEGCLYRFSRQYDLDRHIDAAHPELEVTVEDILSRKEVMI